MPVTETPVVVLYRQEKLYISMIAPCKHQSLMSRISPEYVSIYCKGNFYWILAWLYYQKSQTKVHNMNFQVKCVKELISYQYAFCHKNHALQSMYPALITVRLTLPAGEIAHWVVSVLYWYEIGGKRTGSTLVEIDWSWLLGYYCLYCTCTAWYEIYSIIKAFLIQTILQHLRT